MRRCLALGFLLSACVESSVDFGVILPRDGDAFLADVDASGCYRLGARRGRESFTDDARRWTELSLHGLPTGTYDVELEAVEQPADLEGCTGGEVRARARTYGALLDPDRDDRVPLVLLPVDRPVTLDVPSWVEAWFDGRTDLTAVLAKDAAGVPRLVFAGGWVPDPAGGRVASAEVLVYEPRAARFTALPDLGCARAEAAAVAIGEPGEAEKVLFVGGLGSCSGAESAPANESSELLEPVTGETTLADLKAPVEHPRAVRDGAEVWVMGSMTSEPVVQRFGETPAGTEQGGETWQQISTSDERIPVRGGTITSIFPDGSPRFLVAGGYAGDGEPLRTVSLFEPRGDLLTPCAIDQATVPVEGERVVAVPTGDGSVLFNGTSPEDGGPVWLRQTFLRTCGALDGYERGTLATPRVGPIATAVHQAEGTVSVLSGGDSEGTLEVLYPGVPGTLGLTGGEEPRSRHVAVSVEDGSVLIAGGGPATVRALLPREGGGNRLEWDLAAEPSPALDVIVVASDHGEADNVRDLLRNGGVFDDSGALDVTGPEGLTAAIPPLDDEFDLGGRITVVITSADMRCEGRAAEADGGRPRQCSRDSADLKEWEKVECLLEELHDDDACAAQELLRATSLAAQDPLFAHHEDRPLVILIAAPRDDCSADEEGTVFEPGDAPLTERCAEATNLLDPAEVAAWLSDLRSDPQHPESALVSVMTFGGPAERVGAYDYEACPGIYPTPRLASLSASMGERGHHVDLCHREPGHPPLQWFQELVDNHIFRNVCLPRRAAEPYSCVVAYERERPDGVLEAVRIPQGEDGWSVHVLPWDDGEQRTCGANGMLSISPQLVLPIGAKVGYACE